MKRAEYSMRSLNLNRRGSHVHAAWDRNGATR